MAKRAADELLSKPGGPKPIPGPFSPLHDSRMASPGPAVKGLFGSGSGSVSLGDVLDPKYRAAAVPQARQYRAANPQIPFAQNISDAAIDRPVPAVVQTPTGNLNAGPSFDASGSYRPAGWVRGEQINIAPKVTNGPIGTSVLGHELTHAAQMDTPAAVRQAVVPGVTGHNPARTGYYGSRQEVEAYLSQLKRQFFNLHGSVPASPEEARGAVEQAATDPAFWRTTPVHKGPNGAEQYKSTTPSFFEWMNPKDPETVKTLGDILMGVVRGPTQTPAATA